MDSNKSSGFWRGFTWKRFFIYFIIFFLLNLGAQILFNFNNYPDGAKYLTKDNLLVKAIGAFLPSFIFTFWFEPGSKKKI